MPTFSHGKNTNFQIQDSGGVTRDISNVLRSVNFPRQADTAETTAFTSTVKSYVVGIPGATFSIQGMFDQTVDGYLQGIYGMAAARGFVYGPQGSTAGNAKYTGSCYLTNYTITGGVSDMVQGNVDFQITGAITFGTY